MTRARTLVLAVLLLVVGGCGVPAEDEPRDLAADSVQYDLLAPSSSTTSTTAAASDVRTVQIYLIRDEQLAPRARQMPVNVESAQIVAELLVGPREQELDRGYGTAIPDGTELLGSRLDDTTLVLNLSEELNAVQGERQTMAVAQLVFTVTELQRVDGVRFQIEGESVQVPKGDGTLTSSPLRRADFPALDPDEE